MIRDQGDAWGPFQVASPFLECMDHSEQFLLTGPLVDLSWGEFLARVCYNTPLLEQYCPRCDGACIRNDHEWQIQVGDCQYWSTGQGGLYSLKGGLLRIIPSLGRIAPR